MFSREHSWPRTALQVLHADVFNRQVDATPVNVPEMWRQTGRPLRE
jgi:hypothetical protein